jgi:hypothetical protein
MEEGGHESTKATNRVPNTQAGRGDVCCPAFHLPNADDHAHKAIVKAASSSGELEKVLLNVTMPNGQMPAANNVGTSNAGYTDDGLAAKHLSLSTWLMNCST